jgi:hypothetical protein
MFPLQRSVPAFQMVNRSGAGSAGASGYHSMRDCRPGRKDLAVTGDRPEHSLAA